MHRDAECGRCQRQVMRVLDASTGLTISLDPGPAALPLYGGMWPLRLGTRAYRRGLGWVPGATTDTADIHDMHDCREP